MPWEEFVDITAEPANSALLLAILGVLIAGSVLFSRSAERLGVPVVLLFLILGMLGGTEGFGQVAFEDHQFAVRMGAMALVLILFDGGLNTSVRAIRQVIAPSAVLATVGVALTAALVALCARVLGVPWAQAMLLGAVVSSTDAAAVFAVLRGGRLQLQERLGRTLEVESCINDPMAVILTTSIIAMLTTEQPMGPWLLLQIPVQLTVGAALGLLFGFFGRTLLQNVKLATPGLYPALTLALAFISYGATTLLYGSGFLAVYATAVVLGNANLSYRSGLTRVHDALAWLSQIGMFLMLGLLVFPSRVIEVAWVGLGLALFLGCIARPAAVWLCLLPFKFPAKEVAYIGWIGLRGAVPIILATFPLLAQVEGAEQVFNLVFFIVVFSSLFPGATVRPVTRWLGVQTPEKPAPAAVLEINSMHPLGGELVSFFIDRSLAVCGAQLADIDFPPQAAVVLVVRGQDLVAARGNTELQEGDHVYVFFRPEDRPFMELLFGHPEESPDS